MQINWNAVTAVCAIFVALFTASGWLTDGLREDIRDLRQEMREGFAGMRKELAGVRQDPRKDNKDLRQEMREGFAEMRQEMHEGFAETREDIEALQQDVAFIKGRNRPDQTTNGNAQRPSPRK